MSLYDAAKDALKIAQKIDNIDLVQRLLDVQAQALDIQAEKQTLLQQITALERENESLTEIKKYTFEPNKTYLSDPDNPGLRLCPVCTKLKKIPVPLLRGNNYCQQCKAHYI